MKQKPLMFLTGICVLVAAMSAVSGKDKSKPAHTSDPNNLSQAEIAGFNDNLRAVSAKLNQTNKDYQQLKDQLKTLTEENKRLKSSLPSSEESPKQLTQLSDTVFNLKEKISELERKSQPILKNSKIDLLDLKPKSVPIQYVVDLDEKITKSPQYLNDQAYWTQSKDRSLTQNSSPSKIINKEAEKGIPYYTIPAGSDLAGTTLLSALIGEVPVDSKLSQPLFPFSAMVGRGSLMAANGVPLPADIRGMKIGGYAIGVGSFLDNISCVRAYVTSALFVFQDGHFETVGEERMRNVTEMVDNQSLGYLTTAFGNPCIPGTYFTNAPYVLAALTGASGVDGIGKGLAQFQMSYFAGGLGAAEVPTGSIGKYALGSALSNSSVEAAEWLKNRIKGSFDMVFVPASLPVKRNHCTSFLTTRLTLHISKTIEINKQVDGRRISYGKTQMPYFNDSFK